MSDHVKITREAAIEAANCVYKCSQLEQYHGSKKRAARLHELSEEIRRNIKEGE